MNALLKQLMGDAARLTQAGDLRSASEAIQAALARMSPTGLAGGFGPQEPAPDQGVIDVVAREVPEHPTAPQSPATRRGRFIEGSHTEPAGTRAYKLYIPPAREDGLALPLVVMLHGCTQDPDDFAAGTGMNELAAELGCFVLYPAQSQNANPQRCWNWFKHNHQQRGRGEPALLAGMTRAVMAAHPIDAKQVYVAGLSAGGAMAAILGEAYPELFAAVGVHSGLPTGAATDVGSAFAAMQGNSPGLPASTGLSGLPGMGGARVANRARRPRAEGAPPIIVFHGDKDTTVHPVNGEHLMADCRREGDQGTGASTPRTRSAQGHDYTRHVHRDGQGRVVAEHWVVHGAGHAWSGGRPQGSYTDARGPDATREMLRFFLATSSTKMTHQNP